MYTPENVVGPSFFQQTFEMTYHTDNGWDPRRLVVNPLAASHDLRRIGNQDASVPSAKFLVAVVEGVHHALTVQFLAVGRQAVCRRYRDVPLTLVREVDQLWNLTPVRHRRPDKYVRDNVDEEKAG